MTTADLIRQARASIESGDLGGARQLLTQLIRSPGGAASGEAWWLLAQTLRDPAQKQDCLRRASAAGYSEPVAAPPAAHDDIMSWLAEVAGGAPAPTPATGPTRALDPGTPAPPPLPPMQALSAPTAQREAPAQPNLSLHEFVSLAPAAPAQPAAPAAAEPPPLDLPNVFSPQASAPAAPASAAQPTAAEPYPQADIDLVVELLGQAAGHNEVIRAVIMRRDCSLSEAEALVRHVHMHHRSKVAAKKLPLIMMIAVVTLVGGLVALGRAATMIAGGYVGESISTLRIFVLSLFFGVVLTGGAIFGIVQALRATRKK